MPPWLVPAIKAVGSLVAGGVAANSARKSNDRAWSQTKQMFRMQQADRDAQNAYNSPASMVARLKAAGLSPASYYGGAAQGAASVGSVDGSAPEVTTPDISGAAATAMDSLTNAGQLAVNKRLAESQIDLNAANAIKAMYSGHLDAWDLNQKKRMQNMLDQKIYNDVGEGAANIRKIDAEVLKLGAESSKINSEIERLNFDLEFDKDVRDLRKKLIDMQGEHEKWSAFAEYWNGMVSQFQRKYMDEHGRQVPSDAWTGLLEFLLDRTGLHIPDFSELQGINYGEDIIKFIKEHGKFDLNVNNGGSR